MRDHKLQVRQGKSSLREFCFRHSGWVGAWCSLLPRQKVVGAGSISAGILVCFVFGWFSWWGWAPTSRVELREVHREVWGRCAEEQCHNVAHYPATLNRNETGGGMFF